jgi:imidazole glycerol-phosphate synthase subunit HisH
MEEVVIVNSGKANVASVVIGLMRAGAKSRLSESPEEILNASHVVMPGVGAFGPAMEQLQSYGLNDALKMRITEGKPTLAICLGLHLLAESSEENPGIDGLGIIPGVIKKLRRAPRVPHLGWNDIQVTGGCELLSSGYAYFANSYYLSNAPEGWNVAHTTYGETFISAIEKGTILACQFHPELSGVWGRNLLIRWLKQGRA